MANGTCRNYHSYHTNYKIAAQLDILPREELKNIPRSTLHRFKNTEYQDFIGSKYSNLDNEGMELIKRFAHDRNARSVYKGIILVQDFIIRNFAKFTRKLPLVVKKRIVFLVERVKDLLAPEKILKRLKISKNRFHRIAVQAQHQCKDSITQTCLRKMPNQLTLNEQIKMKNLLEDEEFKGWPVFSIAYYARANDLIVASVNTWYKYAQFFNLNRAPKKMHYLKKLAGIRGEYIHQIWHMDVIVFPLSECKRAYIYFLAENISKYILSYCVADKLSAEIRRMTIMDAFEKYISQEIQRKCTFLMSDGGSENDNSVIAEFLDDKRKKIIQLIAMRDIEFSNSMIEAVNRVIKYRYLRYQNITTIKALSEAVLLAVADYNNKCPHIGIKGLTPLQVLQAGRVYKVDFSEKIKAAMKNRIEENRRANCGEC